MKKRLVQTQLCSSFGAGIAGVRGLISTDATHAENVCPHGTVKFFGIKANTEGHMLILFTEEA